VWAIVRALRAAGTTILLCTQYLDEADQLADGIAVISSGRVIAEGTPAQLKASTGNGSLSVRLLDPTTREAAAAVLAERLGPVHREQDPAALSVAGVAGDRAAEAVGALAAAGIGVADFALGQPSLDEVFLALTGAPAPRAESAPEAASPESASAGEKQEVAS
jgi:ABC-2 type transport system ATP-binding protein